MKRIQIFAVLLALAMGSACSFTKNTNILGGGTSSVTAPPPATVAPGPVPGAACNPAVIDHVRVSPYDISCPTGTAAPNNSAGVLPVGCDAIVTATPKLASGEDVPPEAHGPDITWSIVSGADLISVRDFSGQVFNKHVEGIKAGPFKLQATVCGKTGAWEAVVK